MSWALVRRAWAADLPNGSDKLVLLALADFANGDDRAWPANSTLARKCSRAETAVRDALRRLVAAGHLTRIDRAGDTTMFVVHPICTPPQNEEGFGNGEGFGNDDPTPPQNEEGTPSDIGRGPLPKPEPEPVIEPVKERSVKPTSARASVQLPDWIPRDPWDGFVEMRRQMKKPLGSRAIELTIRKLGELRIAGHAPGDVLDQSVERGWQGVFPIKEMTNGSASIGRDRSSPGSNGTPSNPMVAAVAARLARRQVQERDRPAESVPAGYLEHGSGGDSGTDRSL